MPEEMQMEITMNETRFTRKEAQVLDLLERNPGRVVTRKFLLENVWGYKDGARTRTLDVHISRLRIKLATDVKVRILAVAGLGYLLERFSQPNEAEGANGANEKPALRASVLQP
jgi:DNA-binding response OmpR family regulator